MKNIDMVLTVFFFFINNIRQVAPAPLIIDTVLTILSNIATNMNNIYIWEMTFFLQPKRVLVRFISLPTLLTFGRRCRKSISCSYTYFRNMDLTAMYRNGTGPRAPLNTQPSKNGTGCRNEICMEETDTHICGLAPCKSRDRIKSSPIDRGLESDEKSQLDRTQLSTAGELSVEMYGVSCRSDTS